MCVCLCVWVGGSGRCVLVHISCMGAVGQGRANDIIHREGGRGDGGETGSIRSCWSKALKGGRPDPELRGSGTGCTFERGIKGSHPADEDLGLHLGDSPFTFLFFYPLHLSPSPPPSLATPSSSGCYPLHSAPASGGSSGHAP